MTVDSPKPTVPPRFLALFLPRLPTDRMRRQRFGRSWRCEGMASRPANCDAYPDAETTQLLTLKLGAGNGHRPPASMPPTPARPSMREALGEAEDALLRPLALFERREGADRLAALDEEASPLGLRRRLGVAEARARFPELDLAEMDRDADRRLLHDIADACERYTPLVATDGERGLVLDISGCAHLFGGEEAMAKEVALRLHAQGFALGWALASHPSTAAALARHAAGTILPEGEEEGAVSPLPVSALRIPASDRAKLARLGLVRIGDLLALPRAAMARRFGSGLVERLEEVTARRRRPIEPRRFVPALAQERLLFEPVSLTEDILRLARHLAERLRPDLEARGEGARCLELTLFRVDGQVERLFVRSARPLRDPVRIERLFAERLKSAHVELDVGFGYDLLRLCVGGTEAMEPEQTSLAGDEEAGAQNLHELLDRLGTRLGETCVFSLNEEESHRPERAQRRVHWLAVQPRDRAEAQGEGVLPPRPLRLLVPPEPVDATAEVPDGPIRQFRWRRAHYRVGRIEGPERIAPEWWRADAVPERDYFRIEDDGGRRYWMFREGARPDGASGWFLHGIFA